MFGLNSLLGFTWWVQEIGGTESMERWEQEALRLRACSSRRKPPPLKKKTQHFSLQKNEIKKKKTYTCKSPLWKQSLADQAPGGGDKWQAGCQGRSLVSRGGRWAPVLITQIGACFRSESEVGVWFAPWKPISKCRLSPHPCSLWIWHWLPWPSHLSSPPSPPPASPIPCDNRNKFQSCQFGSSVRREAFLCQLSG